MCINDYGVNICIYFIYYYYYYLFIVCVVHYMCLSCSIDLVSICANKEIYILYKTSHAFVHEEHQYKTANEINVSATTYTCN